MLLDDLLAEIRGCTACAAHLPLGPRPVVQASPRSRVVLLGQAPGTAVHRSGVPWDDDSGKRLRSWLGVDDATFYNPDKFAILPMGLCYPGRSTSGGDAPPRPECAPLWHPPVLGALTSPPLRLLIGMYSQRHYLGRRRKKTLTLTVQSHEEYLADNIFPLPHPSWRVRGWMRRNPWFEQAVLPRLHAEVHRAISTTATAQ